MRRRSKRNATKTQENYADVLSDDIDDAPYREERIKSEPPYKHKYIAIPKSSNALVERLGITDSDVANMNFKELAERMVAYKLNHGEISEIKAMRRRYRNRSSARACSDKRREAAKDYAQKNTELTKENASLKRQLAEAEKQITRLQANQSTVAEQEVPTDPLPCPTETDIYKELEALLQTNTGIFAPQQAKMSNENESINEDELQLLIDDLTTLN